MYPKPYIGEARAKTVNKSRLASELSRLEGFKNPVIELEQYVTPPELAADILWTAHLQGDLDGKVVDLGAGTGILGIGAALLGAKVTLVEKDQDALDRAEKNAEGLGVDVELVSGDVEDYEEEFETVLMNPPFSVHSEQLETFLSTASQADAVYTLANSGSKEVQDYLESEGFQVSEVETYTIGLPATYGFHTEETRETEVLLVVARRQ